MQKVNIVHFCPRLYVVPGHCEQGQLYLIHFDPHHHDPRHSQAGEFRTIVFGAPKSRHIGLSYAQY